jgi:alpha-tubulin suppressor-like RCC1 family protein
VSKPTDITSKLQLNPQEIIKDINVDLDDLYVLTSQGRLLDVKSRFGELRSIKDLSETFDFIDGEIITQISIERFHHAVLTSLGRLFMWGDNESGKLGDKTRTYRENPVEITSNFNLFEGESLKTISLGIEHSSALTSLGRLFMWGDNYIGQLGDGGEKNRLTPVDITSGKATL